MPVSKPRPSGLWLPAVPAYVMFVGSLDALRKELVSKFDINSTGHAEAKSFSLSHHFDFFGLWNKRVTEWLGL